MGSASESLLKSSLRTLLGPAEELRRLAGGRDGARDLRNQLSGGAQPTGRELGQRLVEAPHEALLELRGAELARGPAEPFGDDDPDVEGTVATSMLWPRSSPPQPPWSSSIRSAAPDLPPPYTDQAMLGTEKALGPDTSARLDLLLVRGRHLPRTRNVAHLGHTEGGCPPA